jgi:tRNA (mo5U34)-methyltransferase
MTGMDEQQIRERIRYFDEEGLGWYQNIDLGHGISTKTRRVWGEDIDHPRKRWQEIAGAVPASLAGKSVLDLGCNAGWICFEAVDRGSTDVCGIDHKQGYIDQARFCAEVRGQDVDFRVGSIYDLAELGRTFDIVFCVGILYHCKYLYQAVEAASAICASTIIVETAIHPGNNDLPLVRFVRSSQFAGPDADGSARLPGHWHPNMTALKALFAEQGFTEVDELFTDGGRGGIVAHR